MTSCDHNYLLSVALTVLYLMEELNSEEEKIHKRRRYIYKSHALYNYGLVNYETKPRH